MFVCEVWLARDFLADRAVRWLSPTEALDADGDRIVLPEPCQCGEQWCPPIPAAQQAEEAA